MNWGSGFHLSIPLRMKPATHDGCNGIESFILSIPLRMKHTWRTHWLGRSTLSIPLRMKRDRYRQGRYHEYYFQFLWGWNPTRYRLRITPSRFLLSIPLRMKLIYFYSLFYTLEDKLINISHHSLDLSCELGPHGGTTSSCSHGLLHKLKERGRFTYV